MGHKIFNIHMSNEAGVMFFKIKCFQKLQNIKGGFL